jgi:hypothetical protein
MGKAIMSTSPRLILTCIIAGLVMSGCVEKDQVIWHPDNPQTQVVWHLDNLQTIAGHQIRVEGEPRVIDTPNGKAIEFDGVDDGIFFDVHPLAGMSTFTVEVIFKPYAGGAPGQRFFHMQEELSEERVMFETRLVDNELCFLVHAEDDSSVVVENSIEFRAALRAQRIPVETHLFTHGGHGFGLRKAVGKPVSAWPDLFVTWSQSMGLI